MRQDLYPASETRSGKNPQSPVIPVALPKLAYHRQWRKFEIIEFSAHNRQLFLFPGILGNVLTGEESSTCAKYAQVELRIQDQLVWLNGRRLFIRCQNTVHELYGDEIIQFYEERQREWK